MKPGQKVNHPDKILTPEEVQAVLLALASTIEQFEETLEKAPFKSETKETIKEILAASRSAKKKLEYHTYGGKEMALPDLRPGEEKEHLEPPKQTAQLAPDEFEFTAMSRVTLSNKPGEQTSKVVKTDYRLDISGNLDRSHYLDSEGLPTAAGVKATSSALVTGLTANIHMGHERKYWDSAEHIRWIIDKLQEGFVAIPKITTGDWDEPHKGKPTRMNKPMPVIKGDPHLKEIIEEIKEILVEEDIAGVVVLHKPGFSEFLNFISPSYSCLTLEKDGHHLRAKAADFGGDANKRDKAINDTINMIEHFGLVPGRISLEYMDMLDHFDKTV